MSNELLINVTPSENRVALVENGLLQELHLERTGDISYVGNIYIGRVERVLPGMQAAFVDIGLSRTAFLHAGEIARSRPELESDAADENGEPQIPPINEMIREGQSLPVQVIKDPMGSKGARLTTQLSLPRAILSTCRVQPTSAYRCALKTRPNAPACVSLWRAFWRRRERRALA